MALVINEEQLMLKNSAREFLVQKSPVSALRALRDQKHSLGYDEAIWNEMTGMGWTSLTIPEAYGGLEFGYVGLGQILEEMGRCLVASPLLSCILSATIINNAGNDAQKNKYLNLIASGEAVIVTAIDEKKRFSTTDISTSAVRNDQGYILNGQKSFVPDGHVADYHIVLARTSDDGLGLFIVGKDAEGLQTERTIMMDSRNTARLSLSEVQLDNDTLIGEWDNASDIINESMDIINILLSAEMLGNMTEAFERTMAYLKERLQFGVAIGSFQALQHRAAKLYGEIELCKSLVLHSLQSIDSGKGNLSIISSATKAKVCRTIETVTAEGIQMFGGIGMTDDEEIGFFLKRARVAQQMYGDASYHSNRYAVLNNY